MPNKDKTGPNGMGPRTGRGMGFCNGFNNPGQMNPGFGRGMGRGFGRGMGFRRAWNMPTYQDIPAQNPPTKEDEVKMLEDEAKQVEQEQKELNSEMEEIKKRIKELKK